ncbi:hypothetical protein MMC08_002559 [Hypocenomyce scalaris]|nr:hypothetical protein [Hypocenomyce scalaris]
MSSLDMVDVRDVLFYLVPTRFPLLELTFEIRTKIYEYHLCGYEEIEPVLCVPNPHIATHSIDQPIPHFVLRGYKSPGSIRTQDIVFAVSFLALLRVNRQVSNEALPIFYSKNTFGFSAPKDLYNFARSIAPYQRAMITGIRVPANLNILGDGAVWDTMKKMEGLERVSVAVPERLWGSWKVGAPALQSLYKPMRDGVELVIRLVTYDSHNHEEKIVQEWVCRKGQGEWVNRVEGKA